MDLFDSADARNFRDTGMSKVASNNREWLGIARLVAESIALRQGSVCIDDVLKEFAKPDDVNPNTLGNMFKEKKWEFICYKRSQKTSRRCGTIGIWKLK